MKASDYIVEFFINKGITDVFGYPGGMVTHLMDSFQKYSNQISAHVMYHEQAVAFAACGYAQTSGKPGVAYATSGPGATNLVTGIANAYFDSIPTIFITGQVNTNESKTGYGVRQRGFQETDIVSIVKPITKYAAYIHNTEELAFELEKAYQIAMSGRRGPVVLDVPMNVFRTEIDEVPANFENNNTESLTHDLLNGEAICAELRKELESANAPVFVLGNGVKSASEEKRIRTAIQKLGIPVVSSMIAFDIMGNDELNFGFVGAYGSRTANFVVAKSDLIITIGSRMDIRQVGALRANFAPEAIIVRIDIDPGEFSYPVHEDERQLQADVSSVAAALNNLELEKDYSHWKAVCIEIRNLLAGIDDNVISTFVKSLSESIPDNTIITTDVGQNQVWVAQSFALKDNQKVLFSGGHGAMGYSLPAAIGAYYGSGKKELFCFVGDGGMQMNIQELQYIVREKLPIKVIVFNNNALGMIRHFQEMYFDSRFYQTKPEGGYSAPDFARIAEAYGIPSESIEIHDTGVVKWNNGPELKQVLIQEDTYVIPKLEFGKPNQDQEPLIDRMLYRRIMDMPIKREQKFGGGQIK
jgi:acetolactate synthase-1/2/3 large subunit